MKINKMVSMSCQQLPIEKQNRQSPTEVFSANMDNVTHYHRHRHRHHDTIPTSTNKTKTITKLIKKHRRRRRTTALSTIFITQTKFIILLLSLLLYIIGENNHYFVNPKIGVGVAAASSSTSTSLKSSSSSSEEDDDKEKKEKENDILRRMKVNASPNIPILRRKNSNNQEGKDEKYRMNSTTRKSYNFAQREHENQGNKETIIRGGATKQMNVSDIFKKAGKSGIGGGIPGAIAGVVQVFTLMWLRTVMNYQCRYGSTFMQSLRALYNQGGIPRFYRGLSFALIQAPLARFVATAANDGVETLLANFSYTKAWGAGKSTVIASIVVGMWRIFLMPIDTCKTVLQVDSVDGFRNLMRKVKAGKIFVLYQGAAANAVSAIASHYPWFYTFRVLSHNAVLQNLISSNHLRNAFIGFASSVVSDTFANSIRVVKTAKQAIASKQAVSYGEVIAMILAVDGFKGLFGRGLRTRILGNALQSVLFTVIWRGLVERKNQQPQNDSRRRMEQNESDEKFNEDIPEPLEEERF